MHDNNAAPAAIPAIRGGIPWQHIQFTETCWLWTGPRNKGYGKFAGTTAHRAVYVRSGNTIPAGLELDHLFMKPLCVNPAHLEPVTRAENARRRAAALVKCVNGHAYTPANTYIRPDGHRDCRACIRRRVAAYKRRQTIGQAA